MVSKLYSLSYSGLEVYPVEVEVDVHRGLPGIALIGLLDAAGKESKDRVRAGIKNSNYEFPAQKVVINLAPGDIKKEGTHFDLSIALGVLNASRQIQCDFSEYLILGELSLEGVVREVRGVFPMALKAKDLGKKLILPCGNAAEASLAKDIDIYPVRTLGEVISFLTQAIIRKPLDINLEAIMHKALHYNVDFHDVKGQTFAKRALEVAVSGMHNVLLIGPPGVGKTMLARRVPTILPDMDFEEMLEVTKTYSIAGLLDEHHPLVKERPFRSPHHTSSSVALVGGGANIKPGEISLAHNGVLFLDELPEFARSTLEALRQPLEDGVVNIARATSRLTFPSRFLLIAAMNPCPCGYFGSTDRACHCSTYQIQKYRNKISGPLLDRIDIHVELQKIKTEFLISQDPPQETSGDIRKRVAVVRDIQRERFAQDNIFFNSQMAHKQIRKYCTLSQEATQILEAAVKEMGFSARAYDKILKVSRTIADLAQSKDISAEHVSEAIYYRSLDKNLWI